MSFVVGYLVMATLISRAKALTKTIWFVIILLLLVSLCCYHFVSAIALFRNEDITLLDSKQRKANRLIPLCMDGILTRQQSNKQALLMDSENPGQNYVDCRLHHYQEQDVAACLDKLSSRRSRHQRPVHVAFIGESTVRNQFSSLLRVYCLFILLKQDCI
jgi:hypothetical protein